MDSKLQDKILFDLKKNKKYVAVFLSNGIKFDNVFVSDFDKYTILFQYNVDNETHSKLVYKNVISTIILPPTYVKDVLFEKRATLKRSLYKNV